MENNAFKSSIFGGFNRQDVMNYIEKASRESTELLEENKTRIESLEQETNTLRTQRDELQAQLKTLQASLEQTQSELQTASNRLSVTQDDCNAAKEELSAKDVLCSQSADEQRRMQETIDALQSEVEEYHALKKNIAEVELEAKHRADTICKEAQANADTLIAKAQTDADAALSDAASKAEKIKNEANIAAAATRQKADQHAMLTRQQLNVLLTNCEAQYNRLLESYKGAAMEAAKSLQKAQEDMTQLPSVFDKIQEGLHKFSENTRKKD